MSALAQPSMCGREARNGCSIAGATGIINEWFVSICTGWEATGSMVCCSLHRDSLHIGGAAELLRGFSRVRLIYNSAPHPLSVHSQLLHLFQQTRIKPDIFAPGDNFPPPAK